MTISLRGPLRRFVNFQPTIEVEGGTVEESLDLLCTGYPDLRDVLFGNDGQLRRAHRVALNGTVLVRTELSKSISPGDRVDIVTAIAGG